jgi:hypothetical protein
VRIASALLVAALAVLAGCGSDSGGGATVDAALTVTPNEGTAITDFEFDASGSTSGSRALEFRWDWDGDGVWDTDWSSEAVVTLRFADDGTRTVFVEVADGSASEAASASVTVDGRHGFIDEMFNLPAGGNPRDLAYDGSHIWVTNWQHPTWKLDAVTGDSLGSIPGNSIWTGGITWDGTYLWTVGSAGGMRMFKQDPADGSIEDSFPTIYSAQSSGLDWDPDAGVFYYGSSANEDDGDGDIHVYSSTGTHLSSFPSPRGSDAPRGVAFDGENAWVVIEGRDSLYMVDPGDGAVLGVIGVPDLRGGIDIMNDHILVMVAGVPRRLATVVP